MSIPQEVGRNIVFMREKIGVTQEWLSLETEIAGSYLREIEHGRANPSLDILARIADALQIPLEFLVKQDLKENYDRYFPKQEHDHALFTCAELLFIYHVLRTQLCPDCRDMVESERQRFKQMCDAEEMILLKTYMGR